MGGEALVAGGAARREVARVLEGGEDDGGLALGGDLGLEVLGDREQELLGAAARADAGGDRVVRAQRSRRGGTGAGRAARTRRRCRAGSGPGRPKSQPWPKRAPRARAIVELLLGLDALGEQDGAGALGFGVDGVDDRGDRGRRVLLDEPQVELDDLGPDEGHQRERAVVGADVVQRDRQAEGAQRLDAGEHLGGTVGQGALGELEDDVELADRRARAAARRAAGSRRRAATARR